MLDPKPSSLPYNEREIYVLETAKKLCLQWNFLPPQNSDKDKIQEYVEKRDEYLGINSKFIWTTSPKSLWSSIESLLRSSIESSIESSLMSLLWSSLRSSLWSSIESSLKSSLWSSIESSLKSSLWSSIEFKSWYGFLHCNICYEFNENELIKNFAKYLPEAYKEGLGFAVITDEKFYALAVPRYFLNKTNQLHRDMAPAVVWEDGTEEYWMNGVKCPREIVMTPSRDLNARLLLKEQNAEIRREIVRKIGIERVCEKLRAKTLDKESRTYRHPILSDEIIKTESGMIRQTIDYEKVSVDYELLNLDLGDGRKRPYLKMLNPSTGIYHLEGVPPGIETIKQALALRNQTDEEPVIVT